MTTRLSTKAFEYGPCLGHGTYGVVHKVVRKADKKTLVIKKVRIDCMNKEEQDEALNEVNIMKSINSEHVIKYYDSFIEDKWLHIVMQYVPNGTLFAFLESHQGLEMPEGLIWHWYIKLVLGIHHLHSHHIVHRDIKSLNILLDDDLNPLLGDLGASKVLQTTPGGKKAMVGTMMYFSPEVCEGLKYDHRSDMWALGVVMYECCALKCGHLWPFDAPTEVALARKIVRHRPDFSRMQHYSAPLLMHLKRLLTRDTRERPFTTKILASKSVAKWAHELDIHLPSPEDLASCPDFHEVNVSIFKASLPPSSKSKSLGMRRSMAGMNAGASSRGTESPSPSPPSHTLRGPIHCTRSESPLSPSNTLRASFSGTNPESMEPSSVSHKLDSRTHSSTLPIQEAWQATNLSTLNKKEIQTGVRPRLLEHLPRGTLPNYQSRGYVDYGTPQPTKERGLRSRLPHRPTSITPEPSLEDSNLYEGGGNIDTGRKSVDGFSDGRRSEPGWSRQRPKQEDLDKPLTSLAHQARNFPDRVGDESSSTTPPQRRNKLRQFCAGKTMEQINKQSQMRPLLKYPNKRSDFPAVRASNPLPLTIQESPLGGQSTRLDSLRTESQQGGIATTTQIGNLKVSASLDFGNADWSRQ